MAPIHRKVDRHRHTEPDGGLEKLLSNDKPTHLIIELGGNDGLRGLNFKQTTENLDQMVRQALTQNISVLLIGVRMPPNLGGFSANTGVDHACMRVT